MTPVSSPSQQDLLRVFGKIGLLSFGGPAAQISLMHRSLVEETKWLDEQTFLRALSLCMMLPGPEAMQLATYAGWRLHGVMGGLIAGLLFVLPGAVVIAGLATVYVSVGDVPLVQAAFSGIKAAVIVIVLQALVRLSTKALHTPLAWGLAATAFLALFVFGVPYPLVIAIAAVLGVAASNAAPSHMPAFESHAPEQTRSKMKTKPLSVVALWGGLWAAPIALIAASGHTFLLDVALFFSKLAIVTFGGAYAVLAYMTQTVVVDYGWITTPQMIDALGLAETTPGPLILVTQFVAMTAGAAQGGLGLAIVAGITALWVTFIPCFLWIFLAGPYLEYISARPRLASAMQAITSAVVGVILNLALWFAIHVLFDQTISVAHVAAPLPDLATANLTTLALCGLAALLLIVFKRGMVETLTIMAGAGLLLALL